MPHDPRLIKDESKIEQLRDSIPTWIRRLERPKTPCIVLRSGHWKASVPLAPGS